MFYVERKPKLDTISLIFLDAADLLDAGEWRKGPGYAGCIVGYVAKAANCTPGEIERGPIGERLREHLGSPPAYWNDHICQSKPQAVAALRAAAWSKGNVELLRLAREAFHADE